MTEEITTLEGDHKAALATLEDPNSNPLAAFLDPQIKGPLWKASEMIAGAELCPKIFKGKPADCFIALQMAGRLRIDPMMVLQNAYIIHGKPGFETKLLVYLANERGPFQHEIRYKVQGEGEGLSVTAYAKYKDSEEIAHATVTFQMAKDEGWVGKNPKYRTMPEQMLCYRAAAFLIRRCCPNVTMGYHSVEELRDIEVLPPAEGGASDRLEAKPEAEDAEAEVIQQ